MQHKKISSSRSQLSDEVASYLREAIIAGKLRSGQSVKAEALGEELDVSATPVREALQSLKAEGFLELKPRRGFTVAPLSPEDIRDIFKAHAFIAGELSARATKNAQKDDIENLNRIHLELMTAAANENLDALEEKNHEFHRALNLLAGTSRLQWVLGMFAKYVPRRFYSQIEGWPKTTTDDHSAILKAVADGDQDGARDAMMQHIEKSGEQLAQNFAKLLNDN